MSSVTTHTLKPEVKPQVTEQVTQNIPNRRPMKAKDTVQKSAGAFRTISEVADELRVEQHVLRFWETKFSQIKPLKRGGGRRYYRPEDVELLKNIHHLLYQEGYTIKGVQKLLSATRGNLSARMSSADMQADTSVEMPVEAVVEQEAASPVAKAVAKNKDELKSMLEELKSMRKLIG